MTVQALSVLKNITAWGGVITTIAGVVYGISKGGDIVSSSITLIGVALTSAGHLIGMAQSKHQKAATVAAEARIAEARAEAAAAKKLADNLELKQRPRSLPPEVAGVLSVMASHCPQKDALQITCAVGDNEAWALAEQIKSAFEQGGFTFDRIVPVIKTPPFSGIRVGSKDLSPSPLHQAIGFLLNHFQLPLSAQPIQDNEPFIWSVCVGKKP
jgi:hypothetical protein